MVAPFTAVGIHLLKKRIAGRAARIYFFFRVRAAIHRFKKLSAKTNPTAAGFYSKKENGHLL